MLTRPQKGYVRTIGNYRRFGGCYQDMKWLDQEIVSTIPADNGTTNRVVASIVNIAQGATENQRVGSRMVVKELGFKFTLVQNQFAGDISLAQCHTVRVIIFLDKQCNGAAVTSTDILQDAAGVPGSESALDFRKLNNIGRFKLLMDRSYNLNAPGGLGSNSGSTVLMPERCLTDHFFWKGQITVEYSGATGAITELRSNNIGYMILNGDVTPVGAPEVSIRMVSRTRWVD